MVYNVYRLRWWYHLSTQYRMYAPIKGLAMDRVLKVRLALYGTVSALTLIMILVIGPRVMQKAAERNHELVQIKAHFTKR